MSLRTRNDLQFFEHFLTLLPKEGEEHRLWEEFGTYLFNLMTSTRFKTDAPWQMLHNHLFSDPKNLKAELFPYGVYNEPGGNYKEWFLNLIRGYDKEREEFIQRFRKNKNMYMHVDYNEVNTVIGWKNDDLSIAKEILYRNPYYYNHLSERLKDNLLSERLKESLLCWQL